MKKHHFTLCFKEPLLGCTPKNQDIYKQYIMTRAALDDEQIAEEMNSVESMEEKGWTGFHQDEAGIFLFDYVIKGFLKDACGTLRRAKGTESMKLKAYKKVIDGLVFITPRKIRLELPEGGEIGVIERPLRTSGPTGDRVALARSDTCPAGTKITFDLTILGEVSEKLQTEWFDYGALRGLGQWRNAGYGSFTYELS
jgi:hypothetical protein